MFYLCIYFFFLLIEMQLKGKEKEFESWTRQFAFEFLRPASISFAIKQTPAVGKTEHFNFRTATSLELKKLWTQNWRILHKLSWLLIKYLPSGVMANVPDCNTVVKVLEMQVRNNVHFRSDTQGINSLATNNTCYPIFLSLSLYIYIYIYICC